MNSFEGNQIIQMILKMRNFNNFYNKKMIKINLKNYILKKYKKKQNNLIKKLIIFKKFLIYLNQFYQK